MAILSQIAAIDFNKADGAPPPGSKRPLPEVRSRARQWPRLPKPAIAVSLKGLAAVRPCDHARSYLSVA
jgi:hypothetical protein